MMRMSAPEPPDAPETPTVPHDGDKALPVPPRRSQGITALTGQSRPPARRVASQLPDSERITADLRGDTARLVT